jgi:hypothetical protein
LVEKGRLIAVSVDPVQVSSQQGIRFFIVGWAFISSRTEKVAEMLDEAGLVIEEVDLVAV